MTIFFALLKLVEKFAGELRPTNFDLGAAGIFADQTLHHQSIPNPLKADGCPKYDLPIPLSGIAFAVACRIDPLSSPKTCEVVIPLQHIMPPSADPLAA